MPQTADPMAEIRASFFAECEELLESLQDGLTALQDSAEADGHTDAETVNTVFRAVHSIKGGAGAFGLDALVAFAHRYETVLDALRAGRLALSGDILKLCFQAADALADHVRLARGTADQLPAGTDAVLGALEALTDGDGAPDEVLDFVPLGLALDLPGTLSGEETPRWRVRFQPETALYSSGNEPLHLLRALCELGAAEITCDMAALPPLEDLVPEQACLGWTIHLQGPQTATPIHEVFDFVEDVAVIEIGAEAEARPAPAEGLPPLPADLPLDPVPPPPVPEPAPRATETERPAAPSHQTDLTATVRVDLDRIDRLVNLVGELVINQAMLAQSVAQAGLGANTAVMSGLDSFMMLTRDIQDSVMMIRAQPVKPLFQRMARIVREASAALGKEVRLRTEGEGTEVDKTVIERLADPLTHMIRNAVDHGLETPDVRRACGKPAEGTITLSAQHRSGRVMIEVSDDGAGINREKVREIALRKGLIAPDAVLGDAETDALLFLPGFSTASQVSSLSGRGVGMDVVRSAIQALGGRITIGSERGRGTCFTISLPLTLAVLDGMVVRVAGETLVVPLANIVETAALAPGEVRTVGPGNRVIHIRGEFVPMFDLGHELGYRHAGHDTGGSILLLTAQDDGSRAALIADEIVEQRQVVIKGLQQSCGHVPGIAAATILGDGQIALILDPADLVRSAQSRHRPADTVLSLAG